MERLVNAFRRWKVLEWRVNVFRWVWGWFRGNNNALMDTGVDLYGAGYAGLP
uniref:Uncharacterized protein n=1 Tax=Ciona intestinalis TaxID=7719 RepID=H2XLD0_CIOIN